MINNKEKLSNDDENGDILSSLLSRIRRSCDRPKGKDLHEPPQHVENNTHELQRKRMLATHKQHYREPTIDEMKQDVHVKEVDTAAFESMLEKSANHSQDIHPLSPPQEQEQSTTQDYPFCYLSSWPQTISPMNKNDATFPVDVILCVKAFVKSVASFTFESGSYDLVLYVEDGTRTVKVRVNPGVRRRDISRYFAIGIYIYIYI